MTARRAGTKAEADTAAQLADWQLAYTSITELTSIPEISQSIIRANQQIEKFQKEYQYPNQTADELKQTRRDLKLTLGEIKRSSQAEMEASSKTLIKIANLISMREASDSAPATQAGERSKRLRESSAAPSQTVSTITGAASATTGITVSNNGGLTPQISERTKKQLPLHPGRKVAFRVPSGVDKPANGKISSTPPGVDPAGYEEGAWILATIKKEEKGRYTVQDVEGEDGQEPPVYTATLRSLIPLPVYNVALTDPSHLNAYPEYRRGSTVLALFPDTTSFYKAMVVATPKDIRAEGQRTAPVATRTVPSYKVKFDDDGDQTRLVSAEEVIDFPGY